MRKLRSLFFGALIAALAGIFAPVLDADASSENICASLVIEELPTPLEPEGPWLKVCFLIWHDPTQAFPLPDNPNNTYLDILISEGCQYDCEYW